MLDPKTKEVFYNQGHSIGEKEPDWKRKKLERE